MWEKNQKGQWVATKEYYYSGRDETTQKTDGEYADDMEEFLEGINIESIIVDPAAASFITELKKRGFKVKKAKNDVLDGIRFVGNLLNLGLLLFSENCKETIKELDVYKRQEFGFPVISKKIAGRIDTLQNPTGRNKTVRHAIITGECGAQGHFAKNSRMKLPRKWLQLFAGYENKNEGVNYQIAPFKVSNKCCLYMKEKPCEVYAKENNSAPFLGLMASEGGQREDCLLYTSRCV